MGAFQWLQSYIRRRALRARTWMHYSLKHTEIGSTGSTILTKLQIEIKQNHQDE